MPLPAIYTVHDNDTCCDDCRLHQIRDVVCTVCGEVSVTDQATIDGGGWVPDCWEDHTDER